jgi:hypothetical protein
MCLLLAGCASLRDLTKDPEDQDLKASDKKSQESLSKNLNGKDPPPMEELSESMEPSGHGLEDDSPESRLARSGISDETTDSPDQLGEPKKEREDESERFKKFDHVKYVKKIMVSARDLIGAKEDILLARLCKYHSTEARTLSIYKRNKRKFIVIDYDWDPIEGEWIKSFSSPPRSMNRLRTHLRVSSSGKDCRILQGKIP